MNRSFGRHQQIVRAKEREYEKEAHRMANFTQQQTYSMGSLRIVRLANLNNTVFFAYYFLRWPILTSLGRNTRWINDANF